MRRRRTLARALGLLGAAGALIAACTLDSAGIRGPLSGGSGGGPAGNATGAMGGASSVGTGGMGGTSGAGGAGGQVPMGDPDTCPGTPVSLSPPGITLGATLQGMKDNLHPGCGPMNKADIVFAVTPT